MSGRVVLFILAGASFLLGFALYVFAKLVAFEKYRKHAFAIKRRKVATGKFAWLSLINFFIWAAIVVISFVSSIMSFVIACILAQMGIG